MILDSVCSLLRLTVRLSCGALFPTLFGFCGNFWPTVLFSVFFTLKSPHCFFSFLSNCFFSIWALFFPVPLTCDVIIACTCEQMLSLFDDYVCVLLENWELDHGDVNQGLILALTKLFQHCHILKYQENFLRSIFPS